MANKFTSYSRLHFEEITAFCFLCKSHVSNQRNMGIWSYTALHVRYKWRQNSVWNFAVVMLRGFWFFHPGLQVRSVQCAIMPKRNGPCSTPRLIVIPRRSGCTSNSLWQEIQCPRKFPFFFLSSVLYSRNDGLVFFLFYSTVQQRLFLYTWEVVTLSDHNRSNSYTIKFSGQNSLET